MENALQVLFRWHCHDRSLFVRCAGGRASEQQKDSGTTGKPSINTTQVSILKGLVSGKGAGGMLMKWGVERANEDGVECYLDANPDGKPVYEKYGFKEIETVEFFDGRYEQCFMLRNVKKNTLTLNIKTFYY
jgi:Acetyltransferase (GNAT) domain